MVTSKWLRHVKIKYKTILISLNYILYVTLKCDVLKSGQSPPFIYNIAYFYFICNVLVLK
jgi:hypothetical protein